MGILNCIHIKDGEDAAGGVVIQPNKRRPSVLLWLVLNQSKDIICNRGELNSNGCGAVGAS